MMKTLYDEMKSWRLDIHKHPELGFDEQRTSEKIAKLLESWDLEVHRGIGKTGIVAVLRNGIKDRAIGFRADMDAIPIQEANNFEHRSIYPNVFHGCGHDGHICMLLGAAQRLSIEKTNLNGTIFFIFQPSEENGKGALSMISDGLFQRFPMTEIYALHNMPGLAVGTFAVCEGSIMTSEAIFEIIIEGKGGHASMPSLTIDPIIIGAEIITALQTIVSRSIKPDEWGVVSVTEIITDGARNVIPSKVTIRGDCRALTNKTQEKIEERMRQIVAGICTAHNARGHVSYNQEFIVTVNTKFETQEAIKAARQVAGETSVNSACTPCGASEDFARMLKEIPGCYMLIGNGLDGHHGHTLHNPNYDLNNDILEVGCEYWVKLAKNRVFDRPRAK